MVWKRLQKAYPGMRQADGQGQGTDTFAKGLCWDKLVWVFLTSALLGDVIETFWCGLVNGQWMSRSSVLYGPFSFVWGLGAVVRNTHTSLSRQTPLAKAQAPRSSGDISRMPG